LSLRQHRDSLSAAVQLFAALLVNNLLLAWQPGPDEIWSGPLKDFAAAAFAVAIVIVLHGHIFAAPRVFVEWRDKNGPVVGEVLNVPRKRTRPNLLLTVRRNTLFSRWVLRGLSEIPLSLRFEPHDSYVVEVDTSTPDGHMDDDRVQEALLVRMPCALDGQRLEASVLVERPAPTRAPTASELKWALTGAPWRVRLFVRVQSNVGKIH
jgi:hypothetical protein